ncbi:acyl-CoA synthetase (AMP-forming)/AMP-acid ligase II [Amycolatopsis echigonensis]|uniref:Acyl-CoA synthetase (AMP-forming)/AMP-acid ligase II n=1 Tax=Amycolatopsis echigonensis TaxID=2576905 RepID=A0A2N3X1N6_9PSEU|nr:AMP-binding protein [Amycolatopsis niigatensis]PKW00026.1 acyl-CoA synthetase (AMP-forming)/AMP-acid ligase II [Amycolatopsis niigatensis]
MTETKHGPFDLTGITRGPDGVARYDNMPESLVAAVRASVQAHPEVEAVVEVDGPRLTYAQLWERASEVAGGLRERGIAPGDRTAILLPAGADWVCAFLGSVLAGAIVVPVNTRFAEPEVDYVLTDCGATYVFKEGEPLPSGPATVHDEAVRTDPAAIFYTSGTTGFPKGAITTHENFLSNVETAIRVLELDRADGPSLRNLISVPLFHVTGCNTQLLVQLSLGGTTVILPAFETRGFLAAIAEERINILVTVPAIYSLAIAHPDFAALDTGRVLRVAYGGAPIAPALVARIKEAFPSAKVGNGFGLTEVASIATYLPHEWSTEHADSVGFAVPVVDLAVADADPRTGVGELLVRGPNRVPGYWNKPEATASAIVDGWLHTGDLARIDDEGLVHIVDRAKDMINRGGENVYCVEVENALAGAPHVAEAAVVGVPDDVLGEKVGAVVVPSSPSFDVAAMLDYLDQRLADFKVPQYVAVHDTPLPRNPGGKVLKKALREETAWGAPVRGR